MKIKKWLYVIMLALIAALAFSAFTACDPKKPEPPVAGPEAGVYYYDDDGAEYQVTLSAGNRFTFEVSGENLAGEYTLTGTSLVFDFFDEGKANVSATLNENVLTLTYSGAEMRFLKTINYTVSFDTAGGSAIASKPVVNGRTVARPAAPKRDGFTFIGWFSDAAHTKPFVFETQIITSDTTLYAFWGVSVLGQTEYTVDFDLNYENAASVASVTTIGGKLYNVAEPKREGYTFGGWWISMYDSADKLSYRYNEDMVLNENTTLFALWSDNSASGLAAPTVNVSGNEISWNKTAGLSYRFKVEGPEGFVEIDRVSDASKEKVEFGSSPAGDYIITLTATQSGASAATVRYIKNKALAKVSVFSVVEPSALVFQGVENAERYFITIDCGDDRHNHERFALGENTSYNFVNCPMQSDGIIFTVTAEADGYASSTARFVYDRTLTAVDENTFALDEETETLTWGAVAGAESYVIDISCGNANHPHKSINIGNVTSYCLKTCPARAEGGIEVKIYPVTKGYNSPEAATFVFNKKTLAAPTNLRITDELLTWDAIDGATAGYQVRIGSAQPVTVNTNSFSLADLVATAAGGTDYRVSVRARGANNDSLWSDVLDARYYAMYGTLSYSRGVVSWRPVIGATGYQIRYNGDVSTQRSIAAGESSYEVNLPFAGRNMIEVRFVDGETAGGWVSLNVVAYKITFDSRGGSSVQSVNKVYGDRMSAFAIPAKDGYEFAGWYNSIGGAEGNGAEYTDEFFRETGDIVLYAYWKSVSFAVSYNYYGGMAPEGSAGSAKVVFDKMYTLEIPVPADGTLVFGGWYQEPGGQGYRYTDELGKSFEVWSIADDNTTVYAYWIEALGYRMSSNNSFAVFKGPDINEVANLVIPSTYNDLPVAYIDSGAFSGCKNLKRVEIPDTIVQVGATGSSPFSDCDNLEEINVYHVEGNNIIAYSSADGMLIFDDETTGQKYIMFVPLAKKGSLVIPDGITEIPIRAFAYTQISSVTIPASVSAIRQRAFTGCENLSEIIFKPGGEELIIESSAFANCGSLTSINLPARLGELAFGNESLGVVYGIDLFGGCIHLENIFVEEGNAYYSSLEGVLCDADGTKIIYYPIGRKGAYTVPNTVTAIGDYAFKGHNYLTAVTVPVSVTSIGKEAFYNCYYLKNLTFSGGLAPSELVIGEGAFAYVVAYEKGLNNVVFEASSNVVEIGKGAFANNCGLTKFTVPNTVSKIGEEAFAECAKLTNFTLVSGGSNLTIANYAFRNCVGLRSFTLSDSVSELNMNVFDGCENLQGVYVAEGNEYYSDEDGVLYDIGKTIILFYSLGRDGNVTLPDTLVRIGAGVLSGNLKIESISIPASVEEVQEDAFNGCLYLTDIVFEIGTDAVNPEAGLTVGDRAFAFCATLRTLNLPSHVTRIGEQAFYKAAVLNAINFSEGLVEIGDSAFADTALTTVELPDTLSTLGASAFAGCSALTSMRLSNNLAAIGDYAFKNCEKLSTVTIPQGVDAIGENAFENCYGLRSIIIPNTVKSVASGAFMNCEKLETVTFAGGGTEPLIIGSASGNANDSVFKGCVSLSTVTLPERLTTIGNYVFYECAQLNTVTFETDSSNNPLSNLKVIGNSAFEDSGITEFYISNTVEVINQYAFMNASKLTSVVFEEDGEGAAESLQLGTASARSATSGVFSNTALVTVSLPARTSEFLVTPSGSTAGRLLSVFNGVTTLTSIEIHHDNPFYKSYNGALYTKDGKTLIIFPTGLTSIAQDKPLLAGITQIADYAFNYSQLANFEIPDTVIDVGDFAFAQSQLLSITIPASVLTMGLNVFQHSGSLSTVTFAANGRLTALENYSFQNTAVTQIDLTNTMITRIGGGSTVFGGSPLNSIILPAALQEIGNSAFEKTRLSSVSIPATVTRIGKGAFYGCSLLNQLTFGAYSGEGVEPKLVIEDGTTASSGAFAATALETIEIPSRLTTIGGYAFADATALANVTFEDADNGSLTKINRCAFQNTGLTAFVVPNTVTDLGEEYKTSSNGPHTATYAKTNRSYGVFLDCKKLASITLSNKITKFWAHNIVGCTSLIEIKVDADSENFASFDGVLYNFDGTRLICYPTGKQGNSYDVRANTASIEARAFAEATYLKTVNIPNTVTFLGYGVFNMSPVEEVVFAPGGTADITFDATAPGGSMSAGYNATMFGWSSVNRVVLPARLTKIPQYFFEGCGSLTSVEFEKDAQITTFGNGVFRFCSGLESFVMPDSVTTCEGTTGLFVDCTALSSVTLSKALTTIHQNMFSGCVSLETLEIPASVTGIGNYALQDSGIVNLVIPDTAAFSGTGLRQFENCEKLRRIEIKGNTLTYLNTSFFSGCTALEEVILPETVTELGSTAFLNCVNLTSIDLSHVTEIGSNTFEGCTALESIDLSNVTVIGDYAFKGCESLTEVFISDSIESLGANVFLNCVNLQSLGLSNGNTFYTLGEHGELLNSDGTVLLIMPVSATGEYVIPQGMIVGKFAFAGSNLTKVTLPSTMTELPDGIFANCANLREVVLPDGLTAIGADAFTGSGIESIFIGKHVSSIGVRAFMNCTSLSEIVFAENGSSILAIWTSAFEGCTSLTSVELPRRVRSPQKTSTDRYGNVTITTQAHGIGNRCFFGCTSLDTVTFAETGAEWMVEPLTMGSYAFQNCTSLVSIELPDYSANGSSSYLAVGTYAFAGCTDLVSFSRAGRNSENAYSLGSYAFFGCSSLKTVVIPTNPSFGSFVFSESGLETITLTLVGSTGNATSMFENCKQLRSVKIVRSGNNSETIYERMFAGCSALESVTVENVNGMLYIYESAFADCTALSELKLPKGLKGIYDNAFANCTSLSTFVIQSTVTSVGANAFSGWTAEQTISVEKSESETIGWSADWKSGCLAEIVWPMPETPAGEENQ